MEVTVKLTSVATAVVCLVFAAIVAPYVDQTTFALLGGTFIGLLVAVPSTLLVILISQRRRDEQAQQPPQQPPAPPTQIVERRIVVIVPSGLQRWQQLDAVVGAFPGKISRHTAEQLLLTGAVKVVEK